MGLRPDHRQLGTRSTRRAPPRPRSSPAASGSAPPWAARSAPRSAEYSQEYGPGLILRDGEFTDPGRRLGRRRRTRRTSSTRWRAGRRDPADSTHVERAVDANDGTATDPLVHHSWSEYMAGAVPRGAPWKTYRLPDPASPGDSLDVPGPDVSGDQMLWCRLQRRRPGAAHERRRQLGPAGAARSARPRSPSTGRARWATRSSSSSRSSTRSSRRRRTTSTASTLEDMYVSLWADVDLGGSTDDLVGCDTTLSLGYTYNATNNDQTYGAAPPAVGYDFFLGPAHGRGRHAGADLVQQVHQRHRPGLARTRPTTTCRGCCRTGAT